MRVVLRSLILVVVVVSALVVFEARFPGLDSVTVHEPRPMRTLVGRLALREYGSGEADLDRVIRLDPNNTLAWERRCTAFLGATQAEWVSDCQHALKLETSGANYRLMGSAQEQASQYCAAEASYRAAVAQPDMLGQRPVVLRDAARAALSCGDPSASLNLLHTAEQLDEASASSASAPEETQRAHDALASDHGYMSVVYLEMNQPDKAKEMCFEANPAYADCACQLTGTGLVCSPSASPTLVSAR
jgi:tetratricopeptide (TPR) repeat protein